ncbi:hypothetical protein TNCV_1740821 [Trichonephila clavipes]|uniref:Uncharacterized protein n=1 Tax=Trichonephila clavipes TaxID=2585209 RepID=A0A8X6V1X2_TRICX|nr:hypothetical protein TNCV_1740821 [Trichonephila clavipes]
MSDLSDVKGVMIIGAHLAKAAISRTANLLISSMTTVSRDMTASQIWGVLENKVRAWFPHSYTLSELETALQKDWMRIPMNFVQDIVLSILR